MIKTPVALAFLALCIGAASAQTSEAEGPGEPTRTTVGPSISVTKTQKTIDGRGVETNATESYDKSQSFTSGNGVLNAETKTKTNQRSEVTTPPPPTTSTTRTTTTSEETSR
jgi:hypothetical protein